MHGFPHRSIQSVAGKDAAKVDGRDEAGVRPAGIVWKVRHRHWLGLAEVEGAEMGSFFSAADTAGQEHKGQRVRAEGDDPCRHLRNEPGRSWP